MKNDEILEGFVSLDLKSYIDQTTKNSDITLIKNEKSKHERIKQRIDKQLYNTFTTKIPFIIDILETSHEINKKLTNVKMKVQQYRQAIDLLEDNDEAEFIDVKMVEKLKILLSEFRSDCSVFLNGKRYLVFYDILLSEDLNEVKRVSFLNEETKSSEKNDISDKIAEKIDKLNLKSNQSAYILIFTNDLLIIGKRVRKKFELTNAFNYNIIQLSIENGKLFLKVDPLEFIFTKDIHSLEKIVQTFKEICCKNTKNTGDNTGDKEINEKKNFLEFLQYTEQYDELISVKGETMIKIDVYDIKDDDHCLFQAFKLLDSNNERSELLFDFLEHEFNKKLAKSNPVQSLKEYIDQIYSIMNTFYGKSKEVIKRYEKKYGFSQIDCVNRVVFIEKIVLKTIILLRKRVFGKYAHINDTEKFENQIRQYLTFDGFCFNYLLEFVQNDKERVKENSLKEVKTQIESIVKEMIEK
ncbi:hypothetical protein EDEG_00427 [Edhazardia aedis USNM 41457]|uniref:Uncharacterized protein n=1 Tax=Edhazardia aedis (strain USNM 41457) TaxID=1003232 RepID=J9D103_EDHAE|nr:hypothetical protein EDEG_00427 [Edhazardia aedis USNM 41457]|eukprot:EJW01536.1 hypothetical protein EDEG_00427 [Edhazardia aedis USNM 41457]